MIFLTSYDEGVRMAHLRGDVLRAPTLHKSGEYQALSGFWAFMSGFGAAW